MAAGIEHQFYSHFNESDGLPDVSIQCCAQDEFGRIWIGSGGEGVYYFTGSRFVKLTNEDYLASCSGFTSVLEMDKDKRIWIGTRSGAGFYDTHTDVFTVLEELEDDWIMDIDSDSRGDVWITTNSSIWKYTPEDQALTMQMRASEYNPSYSCMTDNGTLVFTAGDEYLYCYDLESGTLKTVRAGEETSELRYIDYLGGSSVLVSDGQRTVLKVDLSSEEKETVLDARVIESVPEVQCLFHANGQYWIGTTYGLIVLDPDTGETERQYPDILDASTLGGENIQCLFQDKDGNIWAGTLNGGLRAWMFYETGFGRYVSNEYGNSIQGNTIRSICEGPDGRIWLGSEEGYLCSFNPADNTFQDYPEFSAMLSGTWISSIAFRGQELWIATSGEGLHVFDPAKGKGVRRYDLSNNYCQSLVIPEDGSIYVATTGGLFQYNPSTDRFTQLDVLGNAYIRVMLYDGAGHIYVGTSQQGAGLFDIRSNSYKGIVSEDIPVVTGLLLDSKGLLWVATDGGGIYRMGLSPDGTVTSTDHLDRESGLPSNRIGGIVEDRDGILWLSSTNGLVELDPSSFSVRKTYMQNDDVLGGKFSFGGRLISRSGTIYMGSANGLLAFTPDYIRQRFRHSPLHITEIILGEMAARKSVSQKGRTSITSEEIRVKQKEAPFLAISYSAMDYSNPNEERYICIMERAGFRSSLMTRDKMIFYTNLRPGTYDFTVDYEDPDIEDTEAGITITILAPWYRSKWAAIIYILLLLSAIYMIIRNNARKRERKAAADMELYRAKNERDLANEKMDFFMNVAHEIRTPVSVILILLDKLTHHKIPDEMKADLSSIQANTERLKKECDELLDFRKVETGQVQMFFKEEDICKIVRQSVSSFENAAATKGITLDTDIPDAPVNAVCDAHAIESIVCNLISNAIKYGKDRISLSVKDMEDSLSVRVNSNGERIPAEESEKIFNAFYQRDTKERQGTGIGLTYSRQLALKHDGRLFLDTDCADSNSFVLEIPKKRAFVTPVIEKPAAERIEDAIPLIEGMDGTRKMTILIAEDNDLMRKLLCDELSMEYDIIETGNGREALEMVRQGSVDLVVSDIVMPEMDGCELCNSIKEDIHLSHIPVLLLTAAVGLDTHLRSLKSGADGYIEKPFKMNVLRASISNLLRNREIRDLQFSRLPLSHITQSSFNKADQDFTDALTAFINDNISDPDLSINKIADAMAVSRNTLTSKVKALMGVTVNDFIRICRMKKAVELLKENKHRINEVAYLVGYSSPSYFTKSFVKQFGVLPSHFMNKDKSPQS